MPHIPHNPADLPAPIGGYSHGLEVAPNSRYLFISGQIPGAEGAAELPPTFEAQAAFIWTNIGHLLRSAGMDYSDIVKVTTYLTHPDLATRNSNIRRQFLGDHAPAVVSIIAQLLESSWMLEVEVVAAKG